MNNIQLPVLVIGASLVVSLVAYGAMSRREGSYINILTPFFMTSIPAFYLLPLVYLDLFGAQTGTFSFEWVYSALAVEILLFVYAYSKTGCRIVKLPGFSSYSNFAATAFFCLFAGILLYLPVLIQFHDLILDPRQIYMQTRTGFGTQGFVSSTLAYLAVILILFSKRSKLLKACVITVATILLMLHGSKAQALSVLFILLLYYVYVLRRKVRLVRALLVTVGVVAVGLVLFAATMSLGEDMAEMLETVSQYSDYTRNAMLVVDSNYPRQWGRLTLESNVFAVVPRQLMPGKPKNFGAFALAEEFYPNWFDEDTGSPAFGVGIQYADFGPFAIVYLALAAAFKGWLARIFVNRLAMTNHPADFFMVVFLADVSVFPTGIGWLWPEALCVAVLLRFFSSVGAATAFRETVNTAIRVGPGALRPASTEIGD
jgi:oligosaccharide repeat unit polymerase